MTLLPLMTVLVLASAGGEPVDVVENLNEQVPLDLQLRNQDGQLVRLSQLFEPGRPVIITPAYYSCPVLCSTVLKGVAAALKETGLQLGTDFNVVTFSINPDETSTDAKAKRDKLLSELGAPSTGPAGWEFLTGDEATVSALAQKLGFRYRFDSSLRQFVHPAAFMLLTPEGRISRYLYGAQFSARDLRLGLIEAASGRVGTSFDRFILTCTRYDPLARRYRVYVWGVLRAGGTLVFVALAAMLLIFWRRELQFGSGQRPASPPR